MPSRRKAPLAKVKVWDGAGKVRHTNGNELYPWGVMEGMSSDDRFGLQGDPEVREERRVRFGSEHTETLFLVMASLSALISTGLALMGGWDWSSFLCALTLPVALWGWGLWFKARRTATPFKHLGLMVYLTMLGLRYAAELVSDAQAGAALDGWNLGMLVFSVGGVVYLATQRHVERSSS